MATVWEQGPPKQSGYYWVILEGRRISHYNQDREEPRIEVCWTTGQEYGHVCLPGTDEDIEFQKVLFHIPLSVTRETRMTIQIKLE